MLRTTLQATLLVKIDMLFNCKQVYYIFYIFFVALKTRNIYYNSSLSICINKHTHIHYST